MKAYELLFFVNPSIDDEARAGVMKRIDANIVECGGAVDSVEDWGKRKLAYAIDKLQDRGKFFINPQDEVYAGQVVGEHVHDNDLVINVTKSKKLTNMRASGSDDKARIVPPIVFSLEEALEYIKEDEYVEVTPKSMRMRKVILDEIERKRANRS